MTARPVSALAHGLSYWFLGDRASAHHAVNIALFAGSILLVFLVLWGTLGSGYAIATCLLASAYPAPATVFSALMMNSNLAALFWAAALRIATLNWRPLLTGLCITVLLVASAFSYESFVPLFALVPVVAFLGPRGSRPRGLVAVISTGAAGAAIVAYRAVLEPLIYHSVFRRVSLPSDILGRGWSVAISGLRVSVVDTVRVSFRAAGRLAGAPGIDAVALGAVVLLAGVAVYRAFSNTRLENDRKVLLLSVACFLICHSIFVFSNYTPTLFGFESRTQGAIRFASAFMFAAVIFSLAKLGRRGAIAPALGVALCATYFIGTAGQREGWIRAAEYNEKVVSEIDSAMMKAQIESADSLTIIAEIRGLPGSVNGEPVFATWWDLGPALELRHPAMRVRANVYEAKRTVGDANGITVDGYWRAVFPFYYFGEGRGELRLVSSRAQWLELIER